MTKLAEIAVRCAKEAATFHWTGQHAANFAPATLVWTGDTTIETAVKADADEQDADPNAERRAIRAELFAAPHVMSADGSKVHYGTPERFGNTDLPMCRSSRGYHRISYYQIVGLPVTCTVCIGRYGTEN